MKKRPLSLYIHWPFCLSKCPYCDFNSHTRRSIEYSYYYKTLIKELHYYKNERHNFFLKSIYFGGGTPSLMEGKMIETLILEASKIWSFSNNIEITLEANPTSIELKKFNDFKSAGINRVSIGIQSLDSKRLSFLRREHTVKDSYIAIHLAKTLFERFSFDLIYATPNHSLSDWENELEKALEIAGDHLSLYQLTIEPGTSFFYEHKKNNFSLPNENHLKKLYNLTETIMNNHKYYSYEVSNYSKIGQESRHNLTYWTYDNYLGIGPGAHSRIILNNKLHALSRYASPTYWAKMVNMYHHAIEEDEILTTKMAAWEYLIMGLRLSQGINYNDFYKKIGQPLTDFINTSFLDIYIKEKYIINDTISLALTLKGRLMLDFIISNLIS